MLFSLLGEAIRLPAAAPVRKAAAGPGRDGEQLAHGLGKLGRKFPRRVAQIAFVAGLDRG